MNMVTLEGFLSNPWLFLLAGAVAIVGSARVVRLLTYDDFPPTEWMRQRWANLTKGNKWGKIMFCLWCASPYVMAGAIIWFIVGVLWVPWLTIAWWIAFSWAALSYLASIFVYWDEGKPDIQ